MNALPAWWKYLLVFLALLNSVSVQWTPFRLEQSSLTATEGSCVEIICKVTSKLKSADYSFWILNGTWNEEEKKLIGTIVYSTKEEERPVSSSFADRVTYTGSSMSTWTSSSPNFCSIKVCNLKRDDSGKYKFRFFGEAQGYKYLSQQDTTLTVTENPCPITFEKPLVINTFGTVTLTCSTSRSCPSELEITGPAHSALPSLSSPLEPDEKLKTATLSFSATWQDDGKQFSCQTKDNKDEYLIRHVNVTVEYPPQDVTAKKSLENVLEGWDVTLACLADGRPDPTFTWFKDDEEIPSEQSKTWIITSVQESANGKYHCEAGNKQGTKKSNLVSIKVQYKPEVELSSSAYEVEQGDKVTLTCDVWRANPKPNSYVWLLNGETIEKSRGPKDQYVIERIEPEDRGKYKCRAMNTVGLGTSSECQIKVKYGPRSTKISIGSDDNRVKVGASLTLTCNTDANPAPDKYFWSRQYEESPKQTSQRKFKTTSYSNVQELNSVQRGDEACYTCNATNIIHQGSDSQPLCIQVLYAPTKPTLSMLTEGSEGQRFTIRCSVESFPLSTFTLKRTSSSDPKSSKVFHPEPDYYQPPNTLQHVFNLTSDDAGVYTCEAQNDQGSSTSAAVELVVKYRPKRVTVTALPGFVVNENQSLLLKCSAESHPPVASVTWTKTTDGKSEIIGRSRDFSLKSVRPSDRGRYSCTASNEMGAVNSPQAEVKVKYAPKHTKITRAAEHQQPDGSSHVKLSCSSDSYPPIQSYSWYKKSSKGEVKKVHEHKDLTVYSYEAGIYYCVAKNEISEGSSELVHLFDDSWKKLVIIILFGVSLFLVLVILAYRHKRKRSAHRGATTDTSCLFPAGLSGARMNNPAMAEPFRSRDDLLPEQPRCPKARRCQPRPDDTPASSTGCIYSTVNLPSATQVPPAQKPVRQQAGHTQEDSLNYASLHHGNKQMNKRAKAVEDVYAIVSKQKPPQKHDDVLEDYENLSAAHTRSPNPPNSDTETSDDEVEINYSKVSFRAKPGHQRACRDSSSSDEETQYSQVKI